MKKLLLILAFFCCSTGFSYSQSTSIKGLTVVVHYNDKDMDYGLDSIDNMMNQPSGFDSWGNAGSVREYFYDQSGGKVDLESLIIEVQVDSNYSYYHNDDTTYDGGQELLKDVVNAVNAKYPSGFSNLSMHPTEDQLWYFTILSSKNGSHGGPVAYHAVNTLSIKSDGMNRPVRHVAVIPFSGQPDINPVCHELGHNVFGWWDYYSINGNVNNIGHYGIMGSGGRSGSPMPVSPVLRETHGWIDSIIDITNIQDQNFTATTNDVNQVYKYRNTSNPQEYLLIEPYRHEGYYLNIDGDGYTLDQGLAIWYVDDSRGPFNPNIKLIQADGLDEMHDPSSSHREHRGDLTDLFDNFYNVFSDATHPFRWKDGSGTGLIISEISSVGPTMSFKVSKPSSGLLTTYNVPRGSAIPQGFYQYSDIHTLGTGGPDLSNVHNSVFNWWGDQNNPNGLYQFTLETTDGSPRYYTNIPDYGSYILHQSSPEITINSSIGFSGLSGSYWVNLDGDNLVLVEKSGNYALFFSNSSTPPNARVSAAGFEPLGLNEVNKEERMIAPNPFSSHTTLTIPEELGQASVIITNVQGKVVDDFSAEGMITLGNNYKPGIYYVKITGAGIVKQTSFVKQ